MNEVPPGWGSDDLTEYFDVARSNAYASYVNRQKLFGLIVEANSLFRVIDMNNHPLIYPALMLLKAHSAFMTAAELAMSTRASEAYAISRTVIENGLYAIYFLKHPDKIKIWTDRHQNLDSRKMVRQTFTYNAIRDEFIKADPVWGGRAGMLYEDSIDWGAHPNANALHGNLEVVEYQDDVNFNISYLSKNPVLNAAIAEHVLRTGILLINIQRTVFQTRFTAEAMSRMEKLNNILSWDRV